MKGQLIDNRYEIEALVGRGGMSTVYRATDQVEERLVAIKLLHMSLISGAAPTRFYREFRVLTRLDHPHIVKALNYGSHDGVPYLVLEYLEGKTLAEDLGGKALERSRLLHIASQLGDALIYLHNQSIVHRDLKPGNLMLLPPYDKPLLKLMDFGLVRLGDFSVQLTQEGSTIGTLTYIAPEQAQGFAVDFRADLYAFGIVLYEMAAGRPPFVHENAATVLLQQMTAQPPSPRRFKPDLDQPLVDLILQLLAKEPAQRPSSTELVNRYLAQLADESVPVLAPSPTRVDLIPRIPLIGREDALESLADIWNQVQISQGQAVLLPGLAGAGKSRLLTELNVQTHSSINSFFKGTCREQASLPYQPLTDIFDNLVRLVVVSVRRDLPAELTRLLPSMSNQTAPAGLGLGESDSKLRLFSACWQLLKEVTSHQPLILAVEDLHWADPTTLELLGYLLDRIRREPVLFLLTYRPEEAESDKLVADTLRDFSRRGIVQTIEIPLLNRPQVAEFLKAALNWQRMPDWLVDSFYKATDGNPLFIEETLKALAAEGQVAQWKEGSSHELTQLTTTSSPGMVLQLPKSVLALAERRLQMLADEDRRILTTAAVLGPEFTFELLEQVAKIDEEALIDAIERLLASRLIEELPLRGGEDWYRFSQESLRQALLDTISHRRLRLLHKRTGDTIRDLYDTSQSRYWPVLAYHFAGAGDQEHAMKYFTLAGDAAFDLFAYSDAVAHYGQALEIARERLKQDNSVSKQQLAHLFKRRGRSLELDTHFGAALLNYQEMEKLAQEIDSPALELGSLLAQGTIRATPTPVLDYEIGRSVTGRALQLARSLGDQPSEAKALWNMVLLCRFGQDEKAVEYGLQSLEIARQLDLQEQMAYTLNDLVYPYQNTSQPEKAKKVMSESLAIWRELGNLPMMIDNLNNSANFYLRLGEYETTRTYVQEALELSQQTNNVWGEAFAYWGRSYIYLEYGQLDQAYQDMEETLRLGDEGQLGFTQVFIRADLGWIYGQLGLLDRALTIAKQAREIAHEILEEVPQIAWHSLARLSILMDDLDSAAESMAEIDRLEEGDEPSAGSLHLRSEYAFARGDYDEAETLLDRAIAEIAEQNWNTFLTELFYARAEVAVVQGQRAEAIQFLHEAREISQAINSRRTLWQILFRLSQIEEETGQLEQAQQSKEEAYQILQYILQHTTIPALREAFTRLPLVKQLLASQSIPET